MKIYHTNLVGIMKQKIIYLDNAATTPVLKSVQKEMAKVQKTFFGNSESSHKLGAQANALVLEAKDVLAKQINAEREEIYFTSSGSEANTWAIIGLALANKNKGNHLIVSAIEHESVLNACKFLEKQGFEITYVKSNKNGEISPKDIEEAITPKTILISVMMANNEIGAIQNTSEIAKIAKSKNVMIHSDCVQSFGHLNIDVKQLGVTAISVSAHKIGGPKGIGMLYLKNGTNIENIIFGGAQEFGKRGGTSATPLICGFKIAVQEIYKNFAKNNEKFLETRNFFKQELKANFSNYEINESKNNLPNILSVTFKGFDANLLISKLDMENVCVSRGSACTAGDPLPSHVLLAMGKTEDANSTVRFSFSAKTAKSDIKRVITALKNALGEKYGK